MSQQIRLKHQHQQLCIHKLHKQTALTNNLPAWNPMSIQWLPLISTQRPYRGVQLQDQAVVNIRLWFQGVPEREGGGC